MIKDKNIDKTSKGALQTICLRVGGTQTTGANLSVAVMPYAGYVMYATMAATASTSATGTIDILSVTAPGTTTGTSLFTAAGTMTNTTQSVLDASSLLTTTAANGGVAFSSGAIFALQTANAVLTAPSVTLYIRPKLGAETIGY